MKSSASSILLSIALVAQLSSAQFTRIVDSVAEQVCERATDLISRPNGLFDCSCDGSFSIENGLIIGVDCAFRSPRCLGPLCGQATVRGVLSPRGVQDTEFCIAALGQEEQALPAICLSAQGGGFGAWGTLQSCGIMVGETPCPCTVCEGGRSVSFDCSALTVQTPGFLPDLTGPVIGNCVSANSVSNFMGAIGDGDEAEIIEDDGNEFDDDF